MKTININLVSVLLFISAFASVSVGQAKTDKAEKAFIAFLASVDSAQLELQNGKAESFKSLWSPMADITLSGGFGGTVEKGWDAISKRLDWVGNQFSEGTNSIERVVARSDSRFGYVVQLEHIRFVVPETKAEATRDYRVTMIFRREKGGWRIVHRQADSNNVKQAPK